MSRRQDVVIKELETLNPTAQKEALHHVGGSPPTTFQNPWSSFKPMNISTIFSARFFRTADRNNIPVPSDRKGLVPVRKPDWGTSSPSCLKATWLGHASFLVETSAVGSDRGVRVLFDPVFSERTSPVQWIGPKRYNPTPCAPSEIPEVDIIAISHNHYDHLDSWTIKEVFHTSATARNRTPLIACALGNKSFFTNLLPSISPEDIIELDWWDRVNVSVKDIGDIELSCTPAQHTSARGLNDKDRALWCSWTIRELNTPEPGKSVFFAGDTGYRHVTKSKPSTEEEESMPRCPAFKTIGDLYGPIDLALLPIGLYSPRDFMSSVHCAPEDSACIHQDLRAKRSIGMHYGTVRGGISAQYEDVLEPPVRWRTSCEARGIKWGEEAGICDIGETVLV